jgi:hypothetical protein
VEIAVWRLEPDAKFQLMRKNPIQRRIGYVLGKKIWPQLFWMISETAFGRSFVCRFQN